MFVNFVAGGTTATGSGTQLRQVPELQTGSGTATGQVQHRSGTATVLAQPQESTPEQARGDTR